MPEPGDSIHATGFLAREKRQYGIRDLFRLDVATLAARLNEFDDAIAAPIARELWRRCGFVVNSASGRRRVIAGQNLLYIRRCQGMLRRLRRLHFARLIIEGAAATPGLPAGDIGLRLPAPPLPSPRDAQRFTAALQRNLARYLYPGVPALGLGLGYAWRILLLAVLAIGWLPACAYWHYEHESDMLGIFLIEAGTIVGIAALILDMLMLQRLRNIVLYISFTDEFMPEGGDE